MLLKLVSALALLAAGAAATLVPRDDAAAAAAARTVSLSLPRASVRGLNGEPCTKTSECAGDRLCLVSYSALTSAPYVCHSDKQECMCLPSNFLRVRCQTSARCAAGERCVKSDSGDDDDKEEEEEEDATGLCYSCDAPSKLLVNTKPADDGNCAGEATRKPSAEVPSSGLNMDACTKSADCAGGRNCMVKYSALTSHSYVCDSADKDCVCLSRNFLRERCTSSTVCAPGERCYQDKGSDLGLCFSCDAVKGRKGKNVGKEDNCDGKLTEAAAEAAADAAAEAAAEAASSGQASPAPCIAVHHLQHLAASDLVFRAHIVSDVLCDAAGSCATHGHVVVYDGAPMMMGTYCRLHGQCTRERMLVNSPRMTRRGLRVASHTAGLEYTVFAARYETRAEEHVLRALVRAGL